MPGRGACSATLPVAAAGATAPRMARRSRTRAARARSAGARPPCAPPRSAAGRRSAGTELGRAPRRGHSMPAEQRGRHLVLRLQHRRPSHVPRRGLALLCASGSRPAQGPRVASASAVPTVNGLNIYTYDCGDHDRCGRVHGGSLNPWDAECGDDYWEADDDFLWGWPNC
jgi:hypothetical protein